MGIMKAFAVSSSCALLAWLPPCSPPHTASTWSSMLTVAITWKRFSAPQTSPTWTGRVLTEAPSLRKNSTNIPSLPRALGPSSFLPNLVLLSPTSASGERLPPLLLPSPWSLKMTLSSPQPSCTTWSQLSLSSLKSTLSTLFSPTGLLVSMLTQSPLLVLNASSTLLKLALKFLKTVLTVVLMPLLPAGSMTARPPPSLPPLNCATTALLSRLSLATETTAFLVILCKLALLPLLPLHLQPHPPTLLPPTLHPPAPPAHHPQAHFHQLKSALPQLSSPPFLPSLLLLPLLCKSF